ncbi:MAG: DUF5053 domain-containing protein [Prevotella sp.]|jgi:hypothetical protein|nr:DUF5053 domain-containing protein [Prevotella sp.]
MDKRSIIYRELEQLRACKTEEERQSLKQQLILKHKNDSADDAMASLDIIKDEVDTIGIEVKLLQLNKCGVSLTYIAETYLGKSRSYLSQRLHRNLVKGKAVCLTPEEKQRIRSGLQDMSKKLYDLSLSVSEV